MWSKKLILVRLMVAFMSLSIIQPAWGSVKSLNEDIDVLELEKEVEDQELFDEYKMAEEEEALNNRLQSESTQLEKDIKKMNRERKQANKTHKKLANRRKVSEKVYNRVSKKASKTEKELNATQAKVDRLRRKVEKIEQAAIEARDKKIAQQKEIRQLKRENRRLAKRLKAAKRIVIKHNRALKKLRAQKRTAAAKNAKLKRQVKRSEGQAIAKRNEVSRLSRP